MRRSFHFRFSPFFFLTAFIIGFLGTGDFIQSFIWMGAIFFSILIHELGHACVAYYFDQSVIVQFTAFGGVTIPLGPKLNKLQEFLMVLMGPIFGFSLFILATFILKKFQVQQANSVVFLEALRFINLVWTILNLFPVLPMDGGQLLRIGLEGAFGLSGRRFSLLFGGSFSILVAFLMLIFKMFIPAIFFFFFAFQNFELYQQMKIFSDEDEDGPVKEELKEAMQLSKSHDEKAKTKLEEVRKHAGQGLVFVIASQELAENYYEAKDFQKVFDILEPIQDKLLDTGKKILLKSAFELSKDEVVLKLAGFMLVSSPDQEIILLALSSAARQQDLEASLGWLQTAIDYECSDLKGYLEKDYFKEIKKQVEFLEAMKKALE
ncbi:MAG: hypothetical protein EBU93_03815 [Chlamydiae bacterium]|nr:hypothetical protein [Chlamydiota bacterium]